MNKKNQRTWVFIDASNLFYGGEKSLGWKIDYEKLYKYLQDKYEAEQVLYFGGVEIHNFHYDYIANNSIPLNKLKNHLIYLIKNSGEKLNEAELILISRHLQRVKFYLKLQKFGYHLLLKPVKSYLQDDGAIKRKANCDVEMAFYLMKEQGSFDRAIILSGDGDFLPVLKYLKEQKREVIVLARGSRTAKEIQQFAGGNFRDFVRLEKYIRFDENKK